MRERSPKARPDPSPSVSNEPPRGDSLSGERAGRAGTSVPNGVPEAPSPPGAWPSCPPGHRGPNRVHPGRPSRRDRYPGARCAGCRARPAGLSGRLPGGAANFSAPCPSNHLQAQVTAETRAKCGRAPASSPPAPAGPGDRRPVLYRAGGAALRSPRPLTPKRAAPHRWEGAVGRHCACAKRGARSAPHADSGEGLSPPPLLPSRFPSALTWGRAW